MNGIHPGYIWGDSVEWYFGYLGKKRGISGEEVYQEVAGETALGYLPHSSEIAGSVVFFASDLSKPVTGPEPRRELRPLDVAVIGGS